MAENHWFPNWTPAPVRCKNCRPSCTAQFRFARGEAFQFMFLRFICRIASSRATWTGTRWPAKAMTRVFVADDGRHVPAVTADEMREIDRLAIQETGPNLFQMMENAGRNLARMALDIIGDGWERAHVLVLAGGGGSGGGGICAARHLANRDIDVALVLSAPDRLGELPAFQRKVFASTRGHEIDVAVLGRDRADLIIDALIGYNLRDAPQGRAAELIVWANHSGVPILALDVPSGMNATTGECPGAWIKAAAEAARSLAQDQGRPWYQGFLRIAGDVPTLRRRPGLPRQGIR